MLNVLIGTPTIDGKTDVWYNNSLNKTIKQSVKKDINFDVIYPSYDSILPRSRNSLIKLALLGKYDYLVFIDSDIVWNPDDLFKILNMPEDVIGIPCVRKSDEGPSFNVKHLNKTITYNDRKDLIEVNSIGTGLIKFSKRSLIELCKVSRRYGEKDEGFDRWVFEYTFDGLEFISEDTTICNKWTGLGNKVYAYIESTCQHVGTKKYEGDFKRLLKSLKFID